MLSDRISKLFNMLGCNNSDIARAIDCSASNISRIHSGNRTYKPQARPILRLADGIYTFADDNNMLASLSALCHTESDSREVLTPAIVAWLFDTNEDSLPQIHVPLMQKKKAEQKLKSRNFGEKLNEIMELLEMSNMRLARQINVDASHISRFRNGVRSPSSYSALSELLAKALIKRAIEQNRMQTISKLTSIPVEILTNADEGLPAFSAWLYDISGEPDTSDIDRLLDCIESFSPDAKAPLPELSSFLTDEIMQNDATEYWGIDGLREMVMRFLGNAERHLGELWLYSDADMGWMVGDAAFFAKWYALMLACVKRGVKVKIIHNLDRGTEEMIQAIRSCLPLYMSGMIEAYVCRRGRDTRFSHTVFLRPGEECIYSNHIKGTEKDGWYEYITDDKKLPLLALEYKKLLSQCEPLVKIHVDNSDKPFSEKQSVGSISSLLYGLSLGTMPESLLTSILARNSVTGNEAKRITKFCRTQRQVLKSALSSGSVCEFIPLPDDAGLFDGCVRVNLSPSLCNRELYYTPDEYAIHIKAISDLLETNTAYHFYALPEMPFPDIHIVRHGESVTVIRARKPYASFVFTEPVMLHAFESYFEVLKNKYKCDRSEVRQSLKRYL